MKLKPEVSQTALAFGHLCRSRVTLSRRGYMPGTTDGNGEPDYDRGCGVGRGLGVGSDLGVGVGRGVGVAVGVDVAVGVTVAVAVGVAVGVGVSVGVGDGACPPGNTRT